MADSVEKRQLMWRCHRGMLELDLLLMPFIEQQFEKLTTVDKQQFKALLMQEDPTLFGWLMGHEVCSDPELSDIVDKIKLNVRQTKKSGGTV